MATFPFTFLHAGRTFSVVIDGGAPGRSDGAGSAPLDVFVRIVGIRGLHEFGATRPDEPNGRLRDRICDWYDATYVAVGTGRAGELEEA